MIIESTKDPAQIEKLRRRYKNAYFKKKYIGWSDEFDKAFDAESVWYFLKEGCSGKIFSLCRVTYGDQSMVPIEGVLDDIRADVGGDLCEINNFLFKDYHCACFLLKYVFHEIQRSNIGLAVCVVDVENIVAFDMYTSLFMFTDTNKCLEFRDVKYRISGLVVRWDLLVQKCDKRLLAIDRLERELSVFK